MRQTDRERETEKDRDRQTQTSRHRQTVTEREWSGEGVPSMFLRCP